MPSGSAALPLDGLFAVSRLPPSINLWILARLFLAATAITVAVFLLARLIFLSRPKRALTLTELNTRLNRHENGGTGVAVRKWRKLLLPPPKYGDEDELAKGESDGESDLWRIASKPVPHGLRGCLKQVAALAGEAAGPARPEKEEKVTTETALSPPVVRPIKHVRVVEPSRDELETMRAVWASPDMQGADGLGGIGGFRRTRDFYSKSQGGTAVIKRPGTSESSKAAAPGKPIPATRADESEEDSSDPPASTRPARRAPRFAASPAIARTASLSPTPSSRSRSDRASAVPRWVKTKSGRIASPAPARLAVSPDSDSDASSDAFSDEEGDGDVFEEASEEDVLAPTSVTSSLAGIAAVAAAIPPFSSDASIAIAPPSSSPVSVLSGGESPQDSPTPAHSASTKPTVIAARPPKLSITPSSPEVKVVALPPLPVSPATPTSPVSPASTAASTTSSEAETPSPTVGAGRRLSLRVEQALRDKQAKKEKRRGA
ncbi:hypothetical protein Rhopal_000961-T1 [Rhodotorula paludigena]|uniref:Proteophosphoglycan ppg4 n=1 Tax=Rhodotorula paludigena TaxID=86838 RepID=A0AAV5G617_9BASI|nr:hypothetical protein Rhopal_000961-T1 [Rhodotorula paludigena]